MARRLTTNQKIVGSIPTMVKIFFLLLGDVWLGGVEAFHYEWHGVDFLFRVGKIQTPLFVSILSVPCVTCSHVRFCSKPFCLTQAQEVATEVVQY